LARSPCCAEPWVRGHLRPAATPGRSKTLHCLFLRSGAVTSAAAQFLTALPAQSPTPSLHAESPADQPRQIPTAFHRESNVRARTCSADPPPRRAQPPPLPQLLRRSHRTTSR